MSLQLNTKRLTLRAIAETDFEALQKMFNDESVRKYLFDDEILEEDQIKDFISISSETFTGKKYGLWLIVLDETQEEIGFTGLWHFFDENQPQLLYALVPQYTGKGFAAEAAAGVIEYAFSDLYFDYIDASCDAPNVRSHQVAERLGMKKIK